MRWWCRAAAAAHLACMLPTAHWQYFHWQLVLQILASRASVPSPHYARFMGQLVTTARDDIADCAEAAYPSLTLAAAQKLMMFDTPAQAAAHIAEHRVSGGPPHWHPFNARRPRHHSPTPALPPVRCPLSNDRHPPCLSMLARAPSPPLQPTWTVSATGTITFAAAGAAAQGGAGAPSGKATAGGAGVDAMSLMASTLGYASELEKIV